MERFPCTGINNSRPEYTTHCIFRLSRALCTVVLCRPSGISEQPFRSTEQLVPEKRYLPFRNQYN